MTDLRYPIGPLSITPAITHTHRSRWVQDIADAPPAFRDAVSGLSLEQIDGRCW
jgi:hypothetical protein